LAKPWEFDAPLCREIGSEPFFLEENESGRSSFTQENRDALRICKSCDHIADCASWAIENENYGIWGGLTPSERREIRKRKKIVLKAS